MERRGAAIAGARPLSEPPSFHIQERKGLNAHLGSCEACSITTDGGRTSVILFDCDCLFRYELQLHQDQM